MFVGLFRLRKCGGMWLPSLAALALFLLSWPPVDWLLSRPLESRYRMDPSTRSAQAIVVLGSSVSPPHGMRRYSLPDKNTYWRCERAAWLYKHWQSVPVLACGGTQTANEPPVSVTMRELLVRFGVPDSMILTEQVSRSTYENALYGAEILRKHGSKTIALVIEGYAMPRAEKTFRRQGLDVIPAPSSIRELGPVQEEIIPGWRALERNEETLHEVLGLGWYALRGWI